MASRDMTNGQYTTRPSGDDNEGRDQTDKLEEADKTKRRGNTTTTAENRGKDTDGAQLQDRPVETLGQARNRVPLSPVSEKYEKTMIKVRLFMSILELYDCSRLGACMHIANHPQE
jgi:hypothetical protein